MDPANNRLVWGYIVWGAMGVVVAIPELLASVASKDVPFPTISGTVGYIEYWHPEFALLVIGLLVWAAFHAIRVSSSSIPRIPPTQRSREEAPTAGAATLVRIPGGRLRVASEFQPLHPRVYVPLALGVVALAFALVRIARPHDKYLLGEVLYGSIALVWIVIPAWLAYKHGRWVPYATLFRTIQDLESHLRSAAIVFAAGILILLVHLAFYPWPGSIPDIQDLHKKYEKQRHNEKKKKEPSPKSL
jgi:hypothetical protein